MENTTLYRFFFSFFFIHARSTPERRCIYYSADVVIAMCWVLARYRTVMRGNGRLTTLTTFWGSSPCCRISAFSCVPWKNACNLQRIVASTCLGDVSHSSVAKPRITNPEVLSLVDSCCCCCSVFFLHELPDKQPAVLGARTAEGFSRRQGGHGELAEAHDRVVVASIADT